MPGIKDVFLRAGQDSRIFFPENNVSKAGNVISAAPDRLTAVQAAEKAARAIRIRLTVPDTETETFLAGPMEPTAGKTVLFPPPAYMLDMTMLEQLSAMVSGTPAETTNKDEGDSLSLIPFPAFTGSNLRDYVGRTPRQSLDAVRKLTGFALPEAVGRTWNLGREFWTALIRGGYQGAVYYIDRLFSDSKV
jgi:hypothetical protein